MGEDDTALAHAKGIGGERSPVEDPTSPTSNDSHRDVKLQGLRAIDRQGAVPAQGCVRARGLRPAWRREMPLEPLTLPPPCR